MSCEDGLQIIDWGAHNEFWLAPLKHIVTA